jgi:hypothetical protein
MHVRLLWTKSPAASHDLNVHTAGGGNCWSRPGAMTDHGPITHAFPASELQEGSRRSRQPQNIERRMGRTGDLNQNPLP